MFFYANGYGSRVYFDSLGSPWPKHPCTDTSFRAVATRRWRAFVTGTRDSERAARSPGRGPGSAAATTPRAAARTTTASVPRDTRAAGLHAPQPERPEEPRPLPWPFALLALFTAPWFLAMGVWTLEDGGSLGAAAWVGALPALSLAIGALAVLVTARPGWRHLAKWAIPAVLLSPIAFIPAFVVHAFTCGFGGLAAAPYGVAQAAERRKADSPTDEGGVG